MVAAEDSCSWKALAAEHVRHAACAGGAIACKLV